MFEYIVKRIALSFVTLLLVITLVFILVQVIPGGPFDDVNNDIPPEVIENLKEMYGMDQPPIIQYFNYLKSLAKFDLGPSYKLAGLTANDIIARGWSKTAQLGLVSMVIGCLIGMLLGIISALKQGHWEDKVCLLVSTLGITIPNFVVAMGLIYLFAVKLKWLPATGWGSMKQMVLPVITLSLGIVANLTRITKSSMLDVVSQDYIRTAKAKGISDRKVIFVHALKNALIPAITYIGPLTAGVLTGSFIVESVFAIPGIGQEMVLAINNRDYSLILAFTIFFSILLIVFNLITDIVYKLVDPRIKF